MTSFERIFAATIAVTYLLSTWQLANATISITCDIGQNYGPSNSQLWYNTACPPNTPYCTGSGLCSECVAQKDPDCDCPPNFGCLAYYFNPVRGADFCSPFPVALYGQSCGTQSDCNYTLPRQSDGAVIIANYVFCVSTECFYCTNENVRICNQGVLPIGADPGLYGSKNEGRGCIQSVGAWNAYSWPTSTVLPTDPYAYERSQYGTSLSPSVSPSRAPSVGGASASATSAASSTRSLSQTASLSRGASASVTPSHSLSSSVAASVRVEGSQNSAKSGAVALTANNLMIALFTSVTCMAVLPVFGAFLLVLGAATKFACDH